MLSLPLVASLDLHVLLGLAQPAVTWISNADTVRKIGTFLRDPPSPTLVEHDPPINQIENSSNALLAYYCRNIMIP
ncbi:hypothetical protein BGZ79_004612, partial [Entomortierella chlamydospora]